MIWADRVACFWGLLFLLGWTLLISVSGGPAQIVPFLLEPHVLLMFLLAVGVPWLLLRALDFVFGGPIRRRGQVRATVYRP